VLIALSDSCVFDQNTLQDCCVLCLQSISQETLQEELGAIESQLCALLERWFPLVWITETAALVKIITLVSQLFRLPYVPAKVKV
jgi:hypothetical protein